VGRAGILAVNHTQEILGILDIGRFHRQALIGW